MSGFTTETYGNLYEVAEPVMGQSNLIVTTNVLSSYVVFDTSPVAADGTGTWYVNGNVNPVSYTGFTVSGDPIIYDGSDYWLLSDTSYTSHETIEPQVNDDFTCYCAGTLILTERGEIAVEGLNIGDRIVTAAGEPKPIRWIGHRRLRTHGGRYPWADPLLVNPIRIRAGALGANLPRRDLCVSPEHAILIGDILVQAGALVNEVSIIREDRLPKVLTYYHIELAEHALLLAEGVAAESFVDNVNRLSFDNGAEREALVGVPSIAEMPYPRAQSHRQVPSAVHAALMDRARALMGDIAA